MDCKCRHNQILVVIFIQQVFCRVIIKRFNAEVQFRPVMRLRVNERCLESTSDKLSIRKICSNGAEVFKLDKITRRIINHFTNRERENEHTWTFSWHQTHSSIGVFTNDINRKFIMVVIPFHRGSINSNIRLGFWLTIPIWQCFVSHLKQLASCIR